MKHDDHDQKFLICKGGGRRFGGAGLGDGELEGGNGNNIGRGVVGVGNG